MADNHVLAGVYVSDVAAEPDSGGFIAARGFHREFDRHFQTWDKVSRNGVGGVHCSGARK